MPSPPGPVAAHGRPQTPGAAFSAAQPPCRLSDFLPHGRALRREGVPPSNPPLCSCRGPWGEGILPSLTPQGAFRPRPAAAKKSTPVGVPGRQDAFPPRGPSTRKGSPTACQEAAPQKTPRQGSASGHGQDHLRHVEGVGPGFIKPDEMLVCQERRRSATGPWGRGHLALAAPQGALVRRGLGHARLAARARAGCPRPQGPSPLQGALVHRPREFAGNAPVGRREGRVPSFQPAALARAEDPGGEGILPSLAPPGAFLWMGRDSQGTCASAGWRAGSPPTGFGQDRTGGGGWAPAAVGRSVGGTGVRKPSGVLA